MEEKSDVSLVLDVGKPIDGIAVHEDTMFLCCAAAGEVLAFQMRSATGAQVLAKTGGRPSGVAVSSDGLLFIADEAHAAILQISPLDARDVLARDFEGEPMKGPRALTFAADGTLFFTDSGGLGDTGLSRPEGSAFCVPAGQSGQLLLPVGLSHLAAPWGVAVSPAGHTV